MKAPMLPALIALVAMSSTLTSAAEEKGALLRTVKWNEVPLPAGAVLQDKAGNPPTLLVKHDGAKALQLPLWKLEKPGITKKCYALRGKVRYKDVAGIGYLELWNVFPADVAGKPDLRAFSRSLATTGPFARITGTSDWRDVFIPFDATQATQLPKALELNLCLAAAGEVEMTGLELVEFDNPEAMWGTIVTGAASSPSPFHGASNIALLAGGVCLMGIVIWFSARKARHIAETRRMKAMDAMP